MKIPNSNTVRSILDDYKAFKLGEIRNEKYAFDLYRLCGCEMIATKRKFIKKSSKGNE